MRWINRVKHSFRKLYVRWRHSQDYKDWHDNATLLNVIFYQSGLSKQTYSHTQHLIYALQCYKNEENPKNFLEDIKQNLCDMNHKKFGENYSYKFVTWRRPDLTKKPDEPQKLVSVYIDNIVQHFSEIDSEWSVITDELNRHLGHLDLFDENTMQITLRPVYLWDYGYLGLTKNKESPLKVKTGWITKETFEMNLSDVMDLAKSGAHNRVLGLFSGLQLNGLTAVDVSLKNAQDKEAFLMRISTLKS